MKAFNLLVLFVVTIFSLVTCSGEDDKDNSNLILGAAYLLSSNSKTVTVGSGKYSYEIGDYTFKQDYPVYEWNSSKTGLSGVSSVTITLQSTQTYNGHYYVAVYVPTGNVSWIQAAYLANKLGGYLACPNDSAENSFLFGLVNAGVDTKATIAYDSSGNIDTSKTDTSNNSDDTYFWHFTETEHNYISIGPFLGGFQPDGSSEPSGNWKCLDGTSITDASGNTATYTNWAVDLYCDSTLDQGCTTSITDSTGVDQDYRTNTQPNNSAEGQPFMGFGEMNSPVSTWGDYSGDVGELGAAQTPGSSYGFIMEFNSNPGL